MKRAIIFVAITFVLTWTVEFGVIWPAVASGTGTLSGYGMEGMSVMVYALITGMMFMPSVGVLLTRLITREGMRDAWLKPVRFRETWKWWVVAWLGTIALVVMAAVAYFVAFPGDFDPSMNMVVSTAMQAAEEQGVSLPEGQVRLALYVQLATLVVVPFVNILPAFGEEWGWRGYLMPKLLERFNVVPALLIMGVIWGLWHMPLTILGHNYGIGYAGYPVLGVVAMCWMCCSLGVFLSYLTLRTGTCIPAAIAHGFFNGSAAVGVLFSASGGNALVGPAATGVLGVAGFTVAAVLMLVSLRRRECSGAPISVRDAADFRKPAKRSASPERPKEP